VLAACLSAELLYAGLSVGVLLPQLVFALRLDDRLLLS
jgi:hypothetical protein